MKQRFLLKMVLVAAGLFMGLNGAWADVTPVNQDYSDGVPDWISGNTGRYTVNMNEGGYLTVNDVNNGNNGATITGSTVNGKVTAGSDFATSDDFTMFFDLQLTGGNNQPSWFHINDASNNNGGNEAVGTHLLTLFQKEKGSTTWEINGATDQTVTLNKGKWYTFKISKSGSLLYLTVTPTDGGDPVFVQQQIAVKSLVGGLGNMIFQTKRYYAFMAIDNVVVRTLQDGDAPAGVPTTYTIKYRNESDQQIHDDVIINGLVGDEITVSAAQMADITFNDQKYIYKSGNTNLTLVADETSNVITLIYREAEVYTFKVTSSLGTIIASGSDFEANTVYVGYPKYELKNTYLYEAGQSADWYRKSYTLTENVDDIITYNKSAIGNVVFYVEGENIPGATVTTGNNGHIRNSNALLGYANENDLIITTLPAGTYKIVANLHTSSSAGGTSTFTLGENTFDAVGNVNSYNTLKESDAFTVTEPTDLVLKAGGGKTNAVDFVYVIGCAVPASITAVKYATFVPSIKVAVPDGVTAYYVNEIKNNKAQMKDVSVIPANTPVIIYKDDVDSDTEVLFVATADEASNVEGNLLNYSDAETVADGTQYILAEDGGVVGFYKAKNTIPARKAYLVSPVGANFLSFSFDDETTGIEKVENAAVNANGTMFNLAGQRVAQPTKGLYIVNGKKVVVK